MVVLCIFFVHPAIHTVNDVLSIALNAARLAFPAVTFAHGHPRAIWVMRYPQYLALPSQRCSQRAGGHLLPRFRQPARPRPARPAMIAVAFVATILSVVLAQLLFAAAVVPFDWLTAGWILARIPLLSHALRSAPPRTATNTLGIARCTYLKRFSALLVCALQRDAISLAQVHTSCTAILLALPVRHVVL